MIYELNQDDPCLRAAKCGAAWAPGLLEPRSGGI